MISKQDLETIKRWFILAEAGGLILPDGWFGRPHDNQHSMSYLELRPHKLLLELDDQLLLTFTELNNVKVVNSELVLTDFTQLVFDWQEYGSFSSHAKVFNSGIVKLVPPIGTTIS